jgi:hypothetical protein
MTLVSTATVSSGGAASISFSSIPQTGTDLLLVFSVRTDWASSFFDGFRFTLNGFSTTFTNIRLNGNGSTRNSSTAVPSGEFNGNTATSNTFGNGSATIFNYTGSTTKTISTDTVTENNATGAAQTISGTSWNGTGAINALTIFSSNGATLLENSTASLYLITKGSGGATTSP